MKILIATNHSYMFYRFRKELVEALMQEHEVILSTPFVGHEDDLQAMGLRCIETDIDRRSINPFKDMKLLKTYRQMLDELQPDMVVTYSIKPNIYMGTACKAKGIPYVANVQGLGTAFEKPVLSSVVSVMYRSALRKAKTAFFENEENAQFFLNKKIISHRQVRVLPGAGINLDEYPCVPMGDDGVCSFLFVGRIMKEKGVDEFFSAARTLKAEFGEEVAFDVVGFYEDAYREQVDQLVADGIVRFHGFQTDVHPFYEAADCVVLPSYHEGMSNVLLEGAATGRALITSDIPGCREAVPVHTPILESARLHQSLAPVSPFLSPEKKVVKLSKYDITSSKTPASSTSPHLSVPLNRVFTVERRSFSSSVSKTISLILSFQFANGLSPGPRMTATLGSTLIEEM